MAGVMLIVKRSSSVSDMNIISRDRDDLASELICNVIHCFVLFAFCLFVVRNALRM
jgi:hypothetical protein